MGSSLFYVCKNFEDEIAYDSACRIEDHIIDIRSAFKGNLNDLYEYGNGKTVQNSFFKIGIKEIGENDSDRNEYAYISDNIEYKWSNTVLCVFQLCDNDMERYELNGT